MDWNIGRVDRVHLGKDPWVGSIDNYRLSLEVLNWLHERGFTKFVDGVQRSPNCWLRNWITAKELDLQGELAEEWNNYILFLSHNVIYLFDTDDELVWTWNNDIGTLIVKLCYEAISFGHFPSVTLMVVGGMEIKKFIKDTHTHVDFFG